MRIRKLFIWMAFLIISAGLLSACSPAEVESTPESSPYKESESEGEKDSVRELKSEKKALVLADSSEYYYSETAEILEYIGLWEGKRYFVLSILDDIDSLEPEQLGAPEHFALGVAPQSPEGGKIEILLDFPDFRGDLYGATILRNGKIYMPILTGYREISLDGSCRDLLSDLADQISFFFAYGEAGDYLVFSYITTSETTNGTHWDTYLGAYDLEKDAISIYQSFAYDYTHDDSMKDRYTGDYLSPASVTVAGEDGFFFALRKLQNEDQYEPGRKYSTTIYYQPLAGGEAKEVVTVDYPLFNLQGGENMLLMVYPDPRQGQDYPSEFLYSVMLLQGEKETVLTVPDLMVSGRNVYQQGDSFLISLYSPDQIIYEIQVDRESVVEYMLNNVPERLSKKAIPWFRDRSEIFFFQKGDAEQEEQSGILFVPLEG